VLGTDFLQPKVSAIPVYMPVTLDVAKGFKYGTDAQFQQFGRQLQNAAQSFDKMPLTLCNGKLSLRFIRRIALPMGRTKHWTLYGTSLAFDLVESESCKNFKVSGDMTDDTRNW